MQTRVLEARVKKVDVNDDLVEITLDDGARRIMRGEKIIAAEDNGDMSVFGRWALKIQNERPDGASVAMLGGGTCVLPRLLGELYRVDVYEIEPKLSIYAPANSRFILGDYRDTLTGTYDFIVHDLEEPFDRAILESHLNPGGVVLGLEA